MRPEKKFEPHRGDDGLLDRADYLDLAELDIVNWRSYRANNLLPYGPASDSPSWLIGEALPKIEEGWGDARGWSGKAVLAEILTKAFVTDYAMDRKRAIQITCKVTRCAAKWREISETSAAIASGKWGPHDPNILFGEAKSKGDVVTVVGTLGEIAARYPNTSRLAVVSVTEAAALMRKRSREFDIPIRRFWQEDLD